MPLYDYKCQECGASFDKLVPYAQSDNQDCPECGSKNTEKQVCSVASISSGSSGYTGGGCAGGGGFT